jgi:aryl-alcohol dehydrogenase-like predicted oxidoreductase
LLSGKYTRDNLNDPANRLGAQQRLPLDAERGFAVTDKLRPIAQRHNKSVAQIALAWVLANPIVTSAILGTTKISQLDDNLGAVDVELTADDMRELNDATALRRLYPNWFHEFVADKALNAALSNSTAK